MYCANRTSVNATLKTFKIKPKGHNFAKSGRTDVDCKISFKALSYRVYYAAWYAVDLAIWKIKIIYFSKQTTILCGVICPSVNATVPIKLRSGCTYFGIRVVHAWHGTSPPSTSPIFSEIKIYFYCYHWSRCHHQILESCCASVGRAVASDTICSSANIFAANVCC